jgi:hypothetical protein
MLSYSRFQLQNTSQLVIGSSDFITNNSKNFNKITAPKDSKSDSFHQTKKYYLTTGSISDISRLRRKLE